MKVILLLSSLFIFVTVQQVASAQSTKLNPSLVSGGNVFGADITPDGRYVIYSADQEVDGEIELYRVPINGGASVKLNREITISGGDVEGFVISPNSEYLVYWGNLTDASYKELYSVPVLGGDTHQINCSTRELQALFRSGPSIVQDVSITPDSQRVVFQHDHLNFLQYRLYSAPIDQDAPSTFDPDGVNQLLCGNEGTLEMTPSNASLYSPTLRYDISPDSNRVVFTYGSFGDPDHRLYSTSLTSRGATMLNSTAQIGERQLFSISPDSSSVVYVAETNNNGQFSLYSTGINTPSSPISLTTLSNDYQSNFRPQILANSQRVVFTAPSSPTQPYQLYSVPLDGSTAPLNLYPESLFSVGAVSLFENITFDLSPNSQQIVYERDHDNVGVFDLYYLSSTTNTTNPIRLTALPSSNRDFRGFTFSPSGSHVVYKADSIDDNINELFSVSTNGGSSTKLNMNINSDQDVGTFQITNNGVYTVFAVGTRSGTQIDDGVYAVPTTGGEPIQVNNNLSNGAEVESFILSEQGTHVVYWADLDSSGTVELYSFELPVIEDESMCLPIKTQNNSVAVICL